MQVSEHVHALKIPFSITAGPGITIDRFVYAYLVYGSRVCLIDTGVKTAGNAIIDYMKKTGRSMEEISMVVQTHSHPDHIGLTGEFRELPGCKVAAHPAERAWIEDTELQFAERPVPGFHTLVGGPATVDRLIDEGGVLEVAGGLTLEVFHTPGHSKGSVSLLLREDMSLFSGDAVPVPGDMPIYDDAAAAISSIEKLRGITGIKTLLASWDDPKKGGDAYAAMDDGLAWLKRIHDAVKNTAAHEPDIEPMELCGRILAELGIPAAAANPLVARSFMANLALIDRLNHIN